MSRPLDFSLQSSSKGLDAEVSRRNQFPCDIQQHVVGHGLWDRIAAYDIHSDSHLGNQPTDPPAARQPRVVEHNLEEAWSYLDFIFLEIGPTGHRALPKFPIFVWSLLDVGFGAGWQLVWRPQPNWIAIGVFESRLERGHANNRRGVSDKTRRIVCGPLISIVNQWPLGPDLCGASSRCPKDVPKDVVPS